MPGSLRARSLSLLAGVALGALVGVLCGASSAAFLWLLEHATGFRVSHPELVWTLPLAGLGLGLVYERWGTPIRGGNNLVIDTIHDAGPTLPVRMAPMVLVGTVLTHLFGGSAGREGTAVQIGASLADNVSLRLRLGPARRRQLLAAGVAGGFGSVFGTPLAGVMFGLEFVQKGRLELSALVPALVASLVGDLVTRALGILHTPYPHVEPFALSWHVAVAWLVFAAAAAVVTTVFIELTHGLKRAGERWLVHLPLRMMVGGALVVVLWRVSGTSDYLGLGIPTIVRAFGDASLPHSAFAWKLLFTAVTLGAGFLGGEVTPLFFVGAALGSALAGPLGLPLPLACGVGLAAVFAAAANTPLALSIMAVELMGPGTLPHVLVVSALAWSFTGNRSIYPSQLSKR